MPGTTWTLYWDDNSYLSHHLSTKTYIVVLVDADTARTTGFFVLVIAGTGADDDDCNNGRSRRAIVVFASSLSQLSLIHSATLMLTLMLMLCFLTWK